MAYPLNNVTTTFAYTEANTLRIAPPLKTMALVVTGAAVYYSKAEANALVAPGAEVFQPERFVPPGRYYFDESDLLPGSIGFVGLQVRSAVSGVNAQVSAS